VQRGSLPSGPRDGAVLAPYQNRLGRAVAWVLTKRSAPRLRPRERSLRGGSRDTGGDSRYARWFRDDFEWRLIVALLGRGLRASRDRLLVVAGFEISGLSANGRILRGAEFFRRLPAQQSARDQAALPEGRDAQSAGSCWHR